MDKLILAAGMPRSGSTWVYNIIRLACGLPAEDSICGWVGDVKPIPANAKGLIKIHWFEPELVDAADVIIYSTRRVEDAMESYKRVFGDPTDQQKDFWMENEKLWTERANFIVHFDRMMHDKPGTADHILYAIDVRTDPWDLCEKVDKLKHVAKRRTEKGHDKITLLHKNHRSHATSRT